MSYCACEVHSTWDAHQPLSWTLCFKAGWPLQEFKCLISSYYHFWLWCFNSFLHFNIIIISKVTYTFTVYLKAPFILCGPKNVAQFSLQTLYITFWHTSKPDSVPCHTTFIHMLQILLQYAFFFKSPCIQASFYKTDVHTLCLLYGAYSGLVRQNVIRYVEAIHNDPVYLQTKAD